MKRNLSLKDTKKGKYWPDESQNIICDDCCYVSTLFVVVITVTHFHISDSILFYSVRLIRTKVLVIVLSASANAVIAASVAIAIATATATVIVAEQDNGSECKCVNVLRLRAIETLAASIDVGRDRRRERLLFLTHVPVQVKP